jgi:hypothetical protein
MLRGSGANPFFPTISRSRAVAARLVHTQEVAGAIPAFATMTNADSDYIGKKNITIIFVVYGVVAQFPER